MKTADRQLNGIITRWCNKWEIFKQLLLKFGDIKPFLNRNANLGPSSCSRLLAILSDQEKLKHLKLELAAAILTVG